MIETIKKEPQAKIAVGLFIFLSLFWIILQTDVFEGQSLFNHSYAKFFGSIYGIMALLGGIWGIVIAQKWGGIKSVMGRSILMFSLGLFAQEFGQVTLSYIDYALNIQGAYPSIGDIGFFGSIPLYIYGIFLLAKASGVRIGLKSYESKIQAVLIPIVALAVGYFLFLQGYEFDWTNPIKIFLDFGYPLGQAIYISIAFLAFLLSRNILGGIMRDKIFFILFALFIQFLSDYTFLYQSSKGTWSVGGVNDYMYLVAYFFMTLGLLQLKAVLEKLKNK
ncbi:MAG: hypothetical protein AAB583_06020 [Patescibacteria group bacterium]